MYIYACKKKSFGWIEIRIDPWGPDRCPECGNWRVDMQQQPGAEPDSMSSGLVELDNPDEFDSGLD